MSNKSFNKHKHALNAHHTVPAFLQGLVDPSTGRAYKSVQSTNNAPTQHRSSAPRPKEIHDMPTVVNLDEFDESDKMEMLKQLGLTNVNELQQLVQAANHDNHNDISHTNVDDNTKTAKHKRTDNEVADAIESETGKAVYRPSTHKPTTSDHQQTDSTNKPIKKAKTNKSKLTFDV